VQNSLVHSIALCAVAFQAAGWPHQDGDVADAAAMEDLAALREQHARLVEEVESLRMAIEQLWRLASTERRDSQAPAIADLAPVIEQLDSEDFGERTAASDLIQRALFERMWRLADDSALSPEGQHRLRRILAQAASVSRLNTIAIAISPDDRDRLLALVESEPTWIMDVLGNDLERIRSAVRRPPVAGDPAVSLVLAALLEDPLRPAPQVVLLQELTSIHHPLLQERVIDLALTPPSERTEFGRFPFDDFAGSPAVHAVMALRRCEVRAAIPRLIDFINRQSDDHRGPDGRAVAVLETLVHFEAVQATPALLQHARRRFAQVSEEFLQGMEDEMGVSTLPGDDALIAAMRLLRMNLSAFSVIEPGWTNEWDEPVRAFRANADRTRALEEAARIIAERKIIGGEEVAGDGDEPD